MLQDPSVMFILALCGSRSKEGLPEAEQCVKNRTNIGAGECGFEKQCRPQRKWRSLCIRRPSLKPVPVFIYAVIDGAWLKRLSSHFHRTVYIRGNPRQHTMLGVDCCKALFTGSQRIFRKEKGSKHSPEDTHPG